MFGRSGAFPTECVHPVAPPDFLSLPLDRKAEPRGGADQFAVSSAVAVAVASTMAAHEIDHTIEVHQHTVICWFFVSVKLSLYCYFFDRICFSFRVFHLMVFLMGSWMRGSCRTANMTCWSLPGNSSDRHPVERGEAETQTHGKLSDNLTLASSDVNLSATFSFSYRFYSILMVQHQNIDHTIW